MIIPATSSNVKFLCTNAVFIFNPEFQQKILLFNTLSVATVHGHREKQHYCIIINNYFSIKHAHLVTEGLKFHPAIYSVHELVNLSPQVTTSLQWRFQRNSVQNRGEDKYFSQLNKFN